MVLKTVRAKTEAAWSTTKKVLAVMSAWGLIFSLVTIARLAVAFEYDDGLVFSTPAFAKAKVGVSQAVSEQYWSVVNRSYDLESPQVTPFVLAWAFRLCGFKVGIIAQRPSIDGEALQKEWRHLTSRALFCFASEKGSIRAFLSQGNYVLYFGNSDSGILEARKTGIYPIRIKRSSRSYNKEDYHPGSLGELTLPF